jgi:SAM-dependent methyltransferase
MGNYQRDLALMRRVHPRLPMSDVEEKAIVNAWLQSATDDGEHRVLDAGCGFQNGLIVEYRGRFRAVGIDLDPRVLQSNKDLDAKAVANCGAIPLRAGCVDLIFCRFVMEHMEDPGAAMREFFRVLKPGGAAVLTTVNVRNPGMWSVRFVPAWVRTAVRAASFGPELGENAPTFYRANTEADIRSLLEREGFRIATRHYFPTFVWYFRFATPLLLLFSFANRVLDTLGLSQFYGGILVEARKPVSPPTP